jgi:menaquinone-dependent protoporphyrinogen IX oxidase
MPRAIKMSLAAQSVIADAIGEPPPYTNATVSNLRFPTYYVIQEGMVNLVVPEPAFSRKFKFTEEEKLDQFTEVIRKKR